MLNQITPMPMPIIIDGNSGPHDPKVLLASLIVLNTIIIIWILIRYLYLPKKYKQTSSFIRIMFCDEDCYDDSFLPNFPTVLFIILNGFALMFLMIDFVVKLL